MRSGIGALIVLAGVLLAAGCSEEQPETKDIVRPVVSVVVEPRQVGKLGYAGTIEPQLSAALSFRLLGRVVARDVDVGDLVRKDAPLAALDPSALQLQVQAARADLSSAQAQLANASASEERQRALLEAKNTPQAAYDASRQARDSAVANVQATQAALAKAQEQLGYAQLTSDFDGVVTAVGAEIGQVVNPGQMVVTVARSDAREAVIDIPDQQAVLLNPGDGFDIVLQSAPSVTAKGEVREIAPQADSATRTRRVKLRLADPPGDFRLGSTITATPSGVGQSATMLPLSALLEKDGKAFVWVVDPASSTVSLKDVTVAGRNAGSFTVGSGIEAGARVVTAGVNSLQPGQKVKIDGGV